LNSPKRKGSVFKRDEILLKEFPKLCDFCHEIQILSVRKVLANKFRFFSKEMGLPVKKFQSYEGDEKINPRNFIFFPSPVQIFFHGRCDSLK
jgi:hypothetical protein